MTYAYGIKGPPAVGGGLPGLPRRKQASTNAGVGVGVGVPASMVRGGDRSFVQNTILKKSDYPELAAKSAAYYDAYSTRLSHSVVLACAFHPSGRYLAVQHANTRMAIYRRVGDEWLLLVDETLGGSVDMPVWSPNGRYLACRYGDRSLNSAALKVFELVGEDEVIDRPVASDTHKTKSYYYIRGIFWTDDSSEILTFISRPQDQSGTNRMACYIVPESGEVYLSGATSASGTKYPVNDVEMTNDRKYMYIMQELGRGIWIFSYIDGVRTFLGSYSFPQSNVYQFRINPVNGMVAAGGVSNIWIYQIDDVTNFTLLSTRSSGRTASEFNSMIWSKDGKHLIVRGTDGSVAIYKYSFETHELTPVSGVPAYDSGASSATETLTVTDDFTMIFGRGWLKPVHLIDVWGPDYFVPKPHVDFGDDYLIKAKP